MERLDKDVVDVWRELDVDIVVAMIGNECAVMGWMWWEVDCSKKV